MENKEIRNILVENIKKELKDFAQTQRELKKSRKLEFRPKDRSLQNIVDEIANNRFKISLLIYHYRWLKHGLKYWAKQDIHDYWEYQCQKPDGGYVISCRNQKVCWDNNIDNYITYEEHMKTLFENYILDLLEKYKIELSNEEIDKFMEYCYGNI